MLFDPGECICHDIVTSRYVPYIGGELSNKIEMSELAWSTFVRFLLEGESDWLMICVYHKVPTFNHESKMFNCLVNR